MEKSSITPGQLKMMHTLLQRQGLMENKPELVCGFSGGRTTSSRELTAAEAKEMIAYLKGDSQRLGIIKCIWRLAFDCGMIYGSEEMDMRINAGRIDLFCKTRGTVKKPISSQSLAELKRTHRQFESICRSHMEKCRKEQYIDSLRECMKICTENQEYEKSQILKEELKKQTSKRKRHERISIE